MHDVRPSRSPRIWWFMAATAVIGVLLAVRDWVPGLILPLAIVGAAAAALACSRHRAWFLAGVAAGFPLLVATSLVVTWLVAWAALGHPPRPSQDDPKDIGAFVDVPYGVTMALLLGLFPSAVAAVVLAGVEAWGAWTRRPGSSGRLRVLLLVTPTSWGLGYALLFGPLGRVFEWFLD